MVKINKFYLNALIMKYQSQKDEALANLSVYLDTKSLSAIGEHSDLLTEQDIWIEKWANAEDKLVSLERIVRDIEEKSAS